MNPETNRFEILSEAKVTGELKQLLRPDGTPIPTHWPVFTVGEYIVVKDYTFKVVYINETTLVLEPVKIAIIGTAHEEVP